MSKTFVQLAKGIREKMEAYEKHMFDIENSKLYSTAYKNSVINNYIKLCVCVDTLENIEEI